MDNNNNDDLDAMFNDEDSNTSQEPATQVAEATAPEPGPQEPKGVAEPKPGEGEPKPEDGKPGEAEAKEGDQNGQAAKPEGEQADGQNKAPGEEKPEEPAKPLTADDIRQVISDMKTEEHTSAQALASMEETVLNAYYPQGLSNVLVDKQTGRELRTPQDVVEAARAAGGEMSMEEASQWLMNEQYKLNNQIREIKDSARELAETNANFRTGSTRVLEIYKPIFDRYPQLQAKVYKSYMKNVKIDNEKDLVIAAPDIEDFYRDFMEPYVMAFGYEDRNGQGQAPAASSGGADSQKSAIPESKQTAADRMDVTGDGGAGGSQDADPNDAEASLNKLFGE